MADAADVGVSIAFQPIIDVDGAVIFSYEAVYRGPANVNIDEFVRDMLPEQLNRVDIECRAIAIAAASSFGLRTNLNVIFLGGDVTQTRASIRTTLDAAERNGIDPNRIILEINQETVLTTLEKFGHVIDEYRAVGLRISIAHFGAGRAALELLEPYRPEMISLDLRLTRDIQHNGPRQAIVRGLVQTCGDLGIDLIAKHVETIAEYEWLRQIGINFFQGNLFAPPSVDGLPAAHLPGHEQRLES